MIIQQQKHNKQNFELDNLVLAEKRLLNQISALMTDDEEINEAIILNGKLKLKIKELEKEGEVYYE